MNLLGKQQARPLSGCTVGLKTGGRIESILVSLPNMVMWSYGHEATEAYQRSLIEVLRAAGENETRRRN